MKGSVLNFDVGLCPDLLGEPRGSFHLYVGRVRPKLVMAVQMPYLFDPSSLMPSICGGPSRYLYLNVDDYHTVKLLNLTKDQNQIHSHVDGPVRLHVLARDALPGPRRA
jgi:hypothetical protein